jgi:hypothetical protein
MSFFEEDEELKREIEEEVQLLRLEERKKYIHSRALAILEKEKQEKNKEILKQRPQSEDYYILFIEDTIVKTYNKEDILSACDIYPHFSRWVRDHYPSVKGVISLQVMKCDLTMSSRLGPQEKRRQWIGYRIKIF